MLRYMLGAFVVAVATYLAICALLYVQQRNMLYFPQHTKVDAASTNFLLNNDGITLRGWIINPGQSKAIMYFGGNGERIEINRDTFAQWFSKHTIYLLSYRGYGASDGTPEQSALVADAIALYDNVAAQHVSIAAVGRSLGSGVAMQLAANRDLQKIALITPFDSIDRVAKHYYWYLPVSLLTLDKFESWRVAKTLTIPTLVIRAGNDEVIPAANTAALIAGFNNRPQEIIIEGAGHNDLDLDENYSRSLQLFLK